MSSRWICVLVAVLLTACTAPGLDKSGSDVRVLRLATIDSVNDAGWSYGPAAFVRALGEVSSGRLEVVVDSTRFGGGQPQDEADLVAAIRDGDVDGGWPATRAFARAGIDGLEVTELPFVITSYDAQRELTRSSAAESLVRRLDGQGMHGLALLVGPLRRPFSEGPALVTPQAWDGLPVGTKNSAVQEDTVRALGGFAVPTGYADNHGFQAARPVLATELDVRTYWSNDMIGTADNVPADVVLWPKMPVLAVSARVWRSMDAQERAWVTRAAEVAREASVAGTYDDATVAAGLCRRGLRVVSTTEVQRRRLLDAVRSVHDALARDPLAGDLLAIGRRHPDPDSLLARGGCAASQRPSAQPEPPVTGAGDLPSGTYRVRITTADLARAGIGNGPGWTGMWTMVVDDGRYELTCRPVDLPGKDCGNAESFSGDALESGPLTLTGTSVSFGDEAAGRRYAAIWSVDDGTLVFTDAPDEPAAPAHLTLRPWTRIG